MTQPTPALPKAVVYCHASFEEGAAVRYAQDAGLAGGWATANGFAVDHRVLDIAGRQHLWDAVRAIQRGAFQAIAIARSQTLDEETAAVVLRTVNESGATLLSARERIVARPRLWKASPAA